MIQRIRSSIEKLPSLDFCSMIAHNPLRAEDVFSNFYEEISFKKCSAQSVSHRKLTSVNMNIANLEIHQLEILHLYTRWGGKTWFSS